MNRNRSAIATVTFVLLLGLLPRAVYADALPKPSTSSAAREKTGNFELLGAVKR